jgi:hypothetical protein
MKPSDPLLLADGTLRCWMYPTGKVAISQKLATVTILSASSVQTLVHKMYTLIENLKEIALSMIIFSLAFNMDSSIDMDSSQTRSNGDESRAGNEELRKSYHHLSNSLAECSIDPNHALEQATEMLEKVSAFIFTIVCERA